jgi:DNA-binding LytR/AlgR family response regulator
MQIKCMVIDDEPPARALLASYISKVEDLKIVCQCSNSIEAFSFLQKNSVDLMFLDIQMPGMNGLDLIKSLHRGPRIVLTTAFREYASDGFELDVLDYLVKPISFERFLKAVAKYHHYFPKAQAQDNAIAGDAFDQAYMFVKVNKDQVKIFLRDILYMESIKDYLKIITGEKSYITYLRLSYMEEKLPEGKFLRVHKSYIVSLGKVKAFRNDTLKIGNAEIPVGRVYRQRFLDVFSGR